MMSSERFTEKAREAVAQAQQIAQTQHNSYVEPEHLALALLDQEGGVVGEVVVKVGANRALLHSRLQAEIDRLPKVTGGVEQSVSARLRAALAAATKEVAQFHDDYLSTEHLVLGLLANAGDPLARILIGAGLTRDAVLQALTAIRGSQRVTDERPEAKYQALAKYGRDLTAMAAQGKLDPVIGRDEEIRRVIQVLSRRLSKR